MPLSVDEIKTIGKLSGKQVVIHEKCKERADFVLELITDVRDHQVTIMNAAVDPKARNRVIYTIANQIDTINESYPDSPAKALLVNELTAIKKRAEQNISGGTMSFVEKTAQDYIILHDRLRDVLLTDFKQCECDAAPQGNGKKPSRGDVKVTVWEERDRLHIGIVDKATEQISYGDWWDDDARQMFEDGFFNRKHGLENSVLEYAEDMGMLSK